MQLHIDTYGSYLHVKDELFEIRIRKDKKVETHQVAAHRVKSIWLNKGVALSADAVHLALKNNIDIVFLEHNGFPIGRVWHSKLGSTTLIRKKQLEASMDKRSLSYIKKWLGTKIENQINFIKNLKKHRKRHHDYLNDKLEKIEEIANKLKKLTAEHIDPVAEHIRGLEGTAGRLYFETISYVLPPQYKFNGRSFRPAQDSFNAFLNYAYGILYARVEKALIIAGIDPYLGFLHRDDYNYKSMVYDFIEPFRIFADKVVFTLFAAKKINKAHTDFITNGVSLNKDGKVLLIEAFNQYTESDKTRYKGRNQTRNNIIQFEAHAFANELIKNENTDHDLLGYV